MRIANNTASVHSSSMDLPPAAADSAAQMTGEASSNREETREASNRYSSSDGGYTDGVPRSASEEVPTSPADGVASIYDAEYDLLRYVARRRFRIPEADVRPIIHDVFVRYLRHHARVFDVRAWLVTALCNACHNYWRDRKETVQIPEGFTDPHRIAEDVAARVDVARLLACVPRRCRTLLRLRFVEGLEPAEIAARCEIGIGNARVRVHRCLAALRDAMVARSRA